MLIEKNGIKFELKLQGKEIKLTTDKIKGYATFSIALMSEKTAFDYSSLKNEKGIVKGFMFTIEQIESVKKELNRQIEVIKNFLNKNEFTIKCLSYKNFYVLENESSKELKEMNERLFNELSSEFIQNNRKLLKEINRKVEAYSDDVIFYVIEEEKEEIKEELVRELTEEEAKKYNVNDKIGEYVVRTSTKTIDDIDYGMMSKSFKVFKKESIKTIKISRF